MCIGILDGICVTGARDGKVFCSDQKYIEGTTRVTIFALIGS
jgi:hypothetical protein